MFECVLPHEKPSGDQGDGLGARSATPGRFERHAASGPSGWLLVRCGFLERSL